MTGPGSGQSGGGRAEAEAREAVRRRRGLAAADEPGRVASVDETGDGWSERPADRDRDDEILREVPPHHG